MRGYAWVLMVWVGMLTFALIACVSHLRPSASDSAIFLARALLHGHTWIYDGTHAPRPLPPILTYAGESIDAVLYHKKYYVIEGPLPALFLMPVIALGIPANQTTLAAILAAIALACAWEIARRIGVPPAQRIILCGFLLLGTDLFWCATLGDVWFLEHTSSVAFTLLALLELQGKRRAWITAACAACAVASRFSLIGALPVYAFLLIDGADKETADRRLKSFCLTLIPFALCWIAYNEARWHLPYDIGYLLFYHADVGAGSSVGGPLQLRFLGLQLYSFFLRAPERSTAFPYLIPTPDGLALTWTSPALFLSCFAHKPRKKVVALWVAALFTALPNFLYYVNGHSQFGMRHALDFEPFLFILMALAVREHAPRLNIALAVYSTISILVGTWGVWYWLTFYRAI